MRILLLHSSSDYYGASKIFLQTACILKQHGHTPIVVLSNKGDLMEAFIKLGIEVHIINLAILRRKYFNFNGIFNRYKKWKASIPALLALIDKNKIDTIYSNTAAVLIGGYLAHKKKLHHIWHLHEIIEKPIFLHQFFAWCLRNWSDKIIVVSKAVQENWEDALPKNSTASSTPKMFQIYNGILPVPTSSNENYRPLLGIPSNALVIGMAARIHFWKGQSYFVEIATELLNREQANEYAKQPLYFLIAGDPFPGYEYLQTELENKLKTTALKNRVFYIGLVHEMDLFYKSIDVLVLPSQQPDPLPTVILEAMQYGKPVVATAQGGALEMVEENKTGIFIPIHNVNVAVDKITDLLNRNELEMLGAAAKQRVNDYFSPTSFEKNIISVFEN
jgi:glycosyltransferase involved in cell wall biosynthesis